MLIMTLLTLRFRFTKNETNGRYLFVLFYFYNGDLRKELQSEEAEWNPIYWADALETLLDT